MATMTESNCNCGCTAGSDSGAAQGRGAIERPRFFARQLVTPEDLTLGQDYLRNKLRRLNRYLHGWGVVCGARVDGSTKPWKVVVHPGYILGPYGDEIVIERDLCFDLRTRCAGMQTTDPCEDIVDPLCPDQTVDDRPSDTPCYVAVRYKEFPARPVRVQAVGCGCDDTSCEYSRWRDGYEICVLDTCPESHGEPPPFDGFGNPSLIPDCPPCPTEPWVVLAEVTTDREGNVTRIDNCACRRMLRTLAHYWWRCGDAAVEPPPPAPVDEGGPGGPIG